MIDARGVISENDLATLERHHSYSVRLRDSSKREIEKLNVISIVKNAYPKEVNYKEYLRIDYVSGFLEFIGEILRIRKLTKKSNTKVQILIASDPWKSFFYAYIFSLLVAHSNKKTTPIQVQIHADIFDPRWFKASVKNFIKLVIAIPSLFLSKQIRCVSTGQSNNLKRYFPRIAEKIKVISVPLQIPKSDYVEKLSERDRSIVISSRLEPDRGLDSLTEFLGKLENTGYDFSLKIIGAGSLLDDLLEKSISILGEKRVDYLGFLTGEEYFNALSSGGVLVSFAPSESYGRSIREALALGVPVLATSSSGVDLLKQEFPLMELNIIPRNLNSVEIVKTLDEAFAAKTNRDNLRVFQFKNEENEIALIESWIDEH
jgi:glycosyltransferase involved in cell wall biosynthesis